MGLLSKHAAAKTMAAPLPSTTPAPAPQAQAAAPTRVHKVTVPAPETVVEAQVVPKAEVPAAVETRAVSLPPTFALLLGQEVEGADALLNAIIQHADEKPSFEGPFPVIKLLQGNSGGMFTPGDNVPGDLMGLLPVGKKPFTAMFLGYRLVFVAWPEVMSNDAGEGERQKPLYKGHANSADVEAIDALMTAAETIQFTKRDAKPKFNGIGHFKVGVEFLMRMNGVTFALPTPVHYSSAQKTLISLGKAMPNGKLQAAPLRIAPLTETVPTATPFSLHSLNCALAVDAEGKKELQDWLANRDAIMADPEFVENYKTWSTSDVSAAALKAANDVIALKGK